MAEQGKVPAIVVKIKTLMGTMSKAEQRVCQYIVDHPDEVVHLSVSELANASGVSDATVVRASQKTGNNSYQELKIALAQDTVVPLQAINEAVTDEDTPKAILEKVFQSSLNTVRLTYNLTKVEDIDSAASKLLGASRITICGLGNSHTVAMDLQHKLMRLGLNATAYEDNHLQLIGSTFLTKDDVMVCISHSGSSVDIIRSAKIAKENGAYVIALTALGKSPLSEIADLTLFTASSETKYKTSALSSRVALLTIVDAIYTFIALKKPDAIDGFYRVETNLGQTKF